MSDCISNPWYFDEQIVDPDGQAFAAHGVDATEGKPASASTAQGGLSGISVARLAIHDSGKPDTLAVCATQPTLAGTIVEIEDHAHGTGGSQAICTDQALTTELSGYSSVAAACQTNTHVCSGHSNEPSKSNSSRGFDRAALSTWQQQTDKAIRNT